VPRDLAYFVQEVTGRGVLLLHSLWGLTPSVKQRADELASRGYTVLAPDLGFGALPQTETEALDLLASASPDRLARLVLSSAALLQERTSGARVAAVGFGMGGSLGLWASVRLPDTIEAVVSFYGSQQIDFAGSRSSYLVHLAETDEFIDDDEAAFMEATMGLEGLPVEMVRYPGSRHGFAEPEAEGYDAEVFSLAWARTLEYLEMSLGQASDI
jgi:carboxymethylenebutenolidase